MRLSASPCVIYPALLLLWGCLVAQRLSAQAAPNLFRDATLNTISPSQAQKAALFPMTTIEQGAFTCGARFASDVDLLSIRPVIFYDLCNVNNSTRVTKAVDHLVIDCTPGPGLQLVNRPQPYSRAGDPEFTFASGGRPAQCSLDGGAFTPCANPLRLAGLADGPHRLTVRTVEGDGRTGSALQFDWTVDRAPPVAPGVRLSGLSGGDATAVEVTGEGEPGALVGILARAGRASASAQARVDDAGRFRATLDLSAFPDGTIAAVATQIDAAGNASPPGTVNARKDSPAVSAAVPRAAPAPVSDLTGGTAGSGTFPVAAPFLSPVSPSEAAACLSPDPSQWPAASKPYFLVIVDTSGSMGTAISGGTNSCGYQHNRLGDARCAVRHMVETYSGEVNFGLVTYAWRETACSNSICGTCDQITGCFPAQCTTQYSPTDNNFCGPSITEPNLALTIHAGGYLQVPMLQDHYWSLPPDASNVPSIQALVDNNCGNNEIGANSNTPLGGTLFNANQYFSGTYRDPFTSVIAPSPLGTFAQGERTCRSLNVILITDGDESCDDYNLITYPNHEGLAVYEAGRLLSPGVTIGGQTFSIKTSVVGFVGATQSALDNIAAAGGTGTAFSTANEAQLSTALTNIIAGAIKPETGDNLDNNCNGCTDDGFTHYANVQPVPANCCAWATGPQRTTCLNNYKASITPANPLGNLALLPCTTYAQQAAPATWLIYNPGDRCDDVDNNGANGVDEGQLKCGSPLHCPATESCNGQDDDCDGIVDNGCPGVVGPEVCNGCDDDFNGLADDGVAAAPCGFASPANCLGTRSCKPAQPVTPGGCVAGGGWNACSSSPQTETCGDGLDNNCNGALDDGNNCPYAGRTEICNGVDDNCNGLIDEGVTPPPDAKVSLCGVSPVAGAPECTAGVTVSCVGGAWQCAFPAGVCNGPGGCAGTSEICDTLDNNCDGRTNENVTAYGQVCHSDDGSPVPGDGACRNTGTIVCNGPNAVKCSAVKANCASLPGGCAEQCDGIDNDCDGSVDETYLAKGTDTTYFVKPVVTKIASSLWIYSYEATRANASVSGNAPGSGNGYWCQAFNAGDPNCNDAAIPVAPGGVTLDKTRACSGPLTGPTNRIPWFNVTPIEAAQTCKAMGGRLCTTTEWQTACTTNPPSGTTCSWGYSTRGATCTSSYVAGTKFCNLGMSYDFDQNAGNGIQNGLLTAGNTLVKNCWADWSGLLGNSAATSKLFDVTGNLREITKCSADTVACTAAADCCSGLCVNGTCGCKGNNATCGAATDCCSGVCTSTKCIGGVAGTTPAGYPLKGGAFVNGSEAGAACGSNFYIVDQSFQLYDEGFRCCFTVDPTL